MKLLLRVLKVKDKWRKETFEDKYEFTNNYRTRCETEIFWLKPQGKDEAFTHISRWEIFCLATSFCRKINLKFSRASCLFASRSPSFLPCILGLVKTTKIIKCKTESVVVVLLANYSGSYRHVSVIVFKMMYRSHRYLLICSFVLSYDSEKNTEMFHWNSGPQNNRQGLFCLQMEQERMY